MLSQNLEKGFFDLSRVDLHTRLFHLLHLLSVELHELDVGVSLNRLQLVIDDLVVGVDAIDVLEQALEHVHWRRDRCINKQGPAEISASLNQVVCAEMILCVLPHIIATEGGLDSVDGRVLLQLIEEGHAGSRLLRLLITEARVVVDEERTDVGKNEREDPCVLG